MQSIDLLSSHSVQIIIAGILGAAITFLLLRLTPAASKQPDVRHAVNARRTGIPAESREFWVEISEALKDGVPDGITLFSEDFPNIDQMMSLTKRAGDRTCTLAVRWFVEEILHPESAPQDNHLSHLSDPAVQNELRKLSMRLAAMKIAKK